MPAAVPPGAIAQLEISADTETCSAVGRHASWTKSEMTIFLILALESLNPTFI